MKIVLRYYNDWGVLNVMQIKVSSKCKVSELYEKASLTIGKSIHQLKLFIINKEEKTILENLNTFIADYKIVDGIALFAQDVNDPFSDMASSFSSQFDPSIFSSTSANSAHQGQETLFQLIHQNKLTNLELFLEDRQDRQELINNINVCGWNAMHLVCFLGNEQLYLWLLQEGGDVKIISKDGWSCLQIAIWQSHIKLITLIIGSNQIDINEITLQGTVLHIAAKVDDDEIIQILLKHPKIDLNIKFKGQNIIQNAGEKTKKILQQEFMIQNNKQFELMNSFRSSLCQLSSPNSFLLNKPPKPPLIKGQIKVVNNIQYVIQILEQLLDIRI